MKVYDELNGFYAGFMTGSADQGLGVFVFMNNTMVGADFAGTKFDGTVVGRRSDGGYECRVTVSLPPGGTTIQGVDTGSDGINYEVELVMPADFAKRPYFYVATPLGGVNVRLQKVRDLGNMGA